MKKAAVEGSAWRRLPIFFYYLESVLVFLFLSSNMWIIFSQNSGWVWLPHTVSGNVSMSSGGSGFFFCLCFVCLFCFWALGIRSLPRGYRICKCLCSSTVDVGSSISAVEFAPPVVLALSVRTAVFNPVGTTASCGVRDTGFYCTL